MNNIDESRIATAIDLDGDEKQAVPNRTGRTDISSATTTSRQRSQSPLLNMRSIRLAVPAPNNEPTSNSNVTGGSVTEFELKEITQTMNAALDKCLKESEVQRKKCIAYEEKLIKYSAEVVDLKSQLDVANKEREHYRILSENYSKEKQDKQQAVEDQELEKAANLQLRENDTNALREVISSIEDEDKREALQKHFDSLNTVVEEYKQSFLAMEQVLIENRELKNRLEMSEEDKKSLKLCINCKEKFSYLQNDEDSCAHHIGKLKYYSCRGCGRDEYYSCCNRCKQCSRGCKRGRHVAV